MNDAPLKWYYRPVPVIILVILVGPFALPLIFKSPAFNRPVKIALTVVVAVITIWSLQITFETAKAVIARFKELELL